MMLGIPEHPTELPGCGYPSYTDLFVLAKCSDGLIIMAVEGKVRETFGEIVEQWLHKDEYEANRLKRLRGLCDILELEVDDVMDLRYQLLHRTAAALIEAERFSASIAIMLVHSFSPEQEGLGEPTGIRRGNGRLRRNWPTCGRAYAVRSPLAAGVAYQPG